MFRHFKIKNTTGVNQSDVFTAKETSDTGFLMNLNIYLLPCR